TSPQERSASSPNCASSRRQAGQRLRQFHPAPAAANAWLPVADEVRFVCVDLALPLPGGYRIAADDFPPCRRAIVKRAIAAGASAGMAKTELTLISHSTYVSSPSAVRGP